MIDIFSLTQMQKLLHGSICIYNQQGSLLKALEDLGEKGQVQPEEFLGKGIEHPYVSVDSEGLALGVLWSEREQMYVVLGKVRILYSAHEDHAGISCCSKEEFATVMVLIWKQISGQEITPARFWKDNTKRDESLAERLTWDLFKYQESGKKHNPYAQELREHDSIRRGDLQALQESIDEVYSGELGILSSDPVRQYKNLSIWVIASASRCAIEGGVNPEKAFAMCDSFIRNIEDNMSDPLQIEQAAREAEFIFAREVRDLKQTKEKSPMITQVKDYVFQHIHEVIRVIDIAEEIGVSPNYLSEKFRKEEGINLKQYIIDEKITSGEYLLKYTEFSIQEISSICAFCSQSRFSVYFQRKNGMTPMKYRKKYQKSRNE